MAFVDLTLNIESTMLTTQAYWHPKVSIEQLGFIEKEGRNTHKFTLGSHTGSHMDAPYHFIRQGKTIDQLDVSLFVQKAVLIKLDGRGEGTTIGVEDFKPYEKYFATCKAAAIRTGWSKRWMTQGYYGLWPHLTEDAARYLLQMGVKVLAMDMPSPDSAKMLNPGEDSPVHQILLGKEVVLVEYLTNLEAITTDVFTLYAFPLKLKGLDGSPARVIAEF